MFRSDRMEAEARGLQDLCFALRELEKADTSIDGAESWVGIQNINGHEEPYYGFEIKKAFDKLRKQLHKTEELIMLSAGKSLTEVGLYEIKDEET